MTASRWERGGVVTLTVLGAPGRPLQWSVRAPGGGALGYAEAFTPDWPAVERLRERLRAELAEALVAGVGRGRVAELAEHLRALLVPASVRRLVARLIEDGACRGLQWAVSAELATLPWQMVRLAPETWPVAIQVLAAATMTPVARRSRRLVLGLVGDPTETLPGARTEVRALRDRLERRGAVRVRMRLGPLTRDGFVQLVERADALHVALHTEAAGSRWCFYDEAIDGRWLARHLTPPALPWLVVLHGCETAQLGTVGPDAPHAVTYAWLRAGVRYVIATHVPLPDAHAGTEVHAQAWASFYAQLAAGASVPAAFDRLLAELGAPWSQVFVLYGDLEGMTAERPAHPRPSLRWPWRLLVRRSADRV